MKYIYIKIKLNVMNLRFQSTWRITTKHASFVFLIFFFHLSRDIGCALITCTIVWKRQEIIIAIRNGRTKGETLRAFRNGSANYSWVLVYLSFFPLSLSMFSFHFHFESPLSLSLSRAFSFSLEQSWLALLTRSVRTCAGNWKFRAYLPLARFSPARFTCSPPRI